MGLESSKTEKDSEQESPVIERISIGCVMLPTYAGD